jgi:hypothetical protein
MSDHHLRRAAILLGRVFQFVLAALAAMLTLSALLGETNILVAVTFGVFALVLLAFAAAAEGLIRYLRPDGGS